MDKLITDKEYEIHFYEIDYKRKALITSIVNFLGDSAINQSEDIGMGLEYLSEKKLAWVIYKWDITMIRYPVISEKITVRTWPFSFRKFYAYRQYDILDETGAVIGSADSVWFLIDTLKRKPQSISSEVYAAYKVSEGNKNSVDFGKLKPPVVIDEEKSFNVRYSDIDTNKHVNNVKYIDWCIETVPLDIVLKYTLKNIKVVYEKETTYGEMIKASTEIIKEDDKVICLHKIEDKEGNRLTLVKTTWELTV
jgi:medium-chain acyl-[acyl-carrier-protein] hydrolase